MRTFRARCTATASGCVACAWQCKAASAGLGGAPGACSSWRSAGMSCHKVYKSDTLMLEGVLSAKSGCIADASQGVRQVYTALPRSMLTRRRAALFNGVSMVL